MVDFDFSGSSVVGQDVVEALSKHPQIITAYQNKGNTGNPPLDWVLKYVFGENAKMVQSTQIALDAKCELPQLAEYG